VLHPNAWFISNLSFPYLYNIILYSNRNVNKKYLFSGVRENGFLKRFLKQEAIATALIPYKAFV
jgi:hypothetical protein